MFNVTFKQLILFKRNFIKNIKYNRFFVFLLVIETMDQCVSLFCTTIKNQPICLLVKLMV